MLRLLAAECVFGVLPILSEPTDPGSLTQKPTFRPPFHLLGTGRLFRFQIVAAPAVFGLRDFS